MAGSGGEFVEGWFVQQLLGEGAYGEVRLLVHGGSGARVALKAVRGGGGGGGGAREAALHRALRHAHVVRCLGERAHGGVHYLFLEYCAGGELFERIEPDRGLSAAGARRYWRQLAAGLRYLHARGVAHRDIKPENLLLDHRDNIKISDFGMATLFRHGSRERLLARVCGTRPYAAPEVHAAPRAPYRAPPADVWPAAVVLVAMLLGELPWECAEESDPRYSWWAAWVRGGGQAGGGGEGAARGVWRRLGAPALAWCVRALQPAPAARATLTDLLLHPWMQGAPSDPAEGARGCLSQPARAERDETDAGGGGRGEGGDLTPADMDALLGGYSQPARGDELLPAAGRRGAGVRLAGGAAAAWRALEAAAAARGWTLRRLDARSAALDCGAGLHMRAELAAADGGTLLHCRRWRGCGLHFQRAYRHLRDALDAAPPPPPPPTPPHAEPMDVGRD